MQDLCSLACLDCRAFAANWVGHADQNWRGKAPVRAEAFAFATPTCMHRRAMQTLSSLFGWLVADGWCWFVLREEYCWLVAGGWFVLREKYCWLVADKPSEQPGRFVMQRNMMDAITQTAQLISCILA
jgi:hypothetical protein